MEKTINITLKANYPVSYAGKIDVIIKETETGEERIITVPMDESIEDELSSACDIGMEILSLVRIMVDEMRFNEEEMEE